MPEYIRREAAIVKATKVLADDYDAYNVKVSLQAIPADDVVEVVRCKNCKHRILNEHYGEKGYLRIKAMCELVTGDPFELSRNAEYDDWFCADGERKDGGTGK